MNNKMIFQALVILVSCTVSSYGSKAYCNIPKECQVIEITKGQLPKNQKQLICRLNEASQLRFNKSYIDNEESKNCKQFNKNKTSELIIRPNKERSLKMKQGMIDLKNLIEYASSFHFFYSLNLVFELFNGFDINLFDDKEIPNEINVEINCIYCTFDFYLGDKLLKTCQDFEATNSTNPRSIFQLLTKISNNIIMLHLPETSIDICPLVFKNFHTYTLYISGRNSFYSRRLLKFSPERYDYLNSKIHYIDINFPDVDLDLNFLHPSVFQRLSTIAISNNVNRIHPDLFHVLDNVTDIFLPLEYLRSIMHKNGIQWIKNINKDINCDLNNISQVFNYALSNKIKFIKHDLDNRPLSPIIRDVFPDEDFCLYKDFPINQLVFMMRTVDYYFDILKENRPRKDVGCTYLWITRSYGALIKIYATSKYTLSVLESVSNESIPRCNFDEKVKFCNRSNFQYRNIITFNEIEKALYTNTIVLNISSYVIVIFGLVSNILIIITLSSKINKTDFKEFKQYDYLRLNSICNCLILTIHMTTWLNDCIYPFQVFCPVIRKTIFMQYFKIIVQDVLLTALRFMNSFTYIGFAFNRISLIGKDHNKLVIFMCEIGIKKFVGISLFISIVLSVIKFFEYDINYGIALNSYPISYDYNISSYLENPNMVFFIINFISDLLNHFFLLLLNLAIDIGMIIKLRQTLNERFEKFKEYSTTAQQEKKKTDNETVLDNAISMVILNTILNLLLKLPASFCSLIYLWYSIYLQQNIPLTWGNFILERFFKRYFIDANLSGFIQKLSDFLYLLSISLQFFFYKHYDKKLNSAIKKKFGSKKNIQTGLYPLINLVNIVTSPDLADEKLKNQN